MDRCDNSSNDLVDPRLATPLDRRDSASRATSSHASGFNRIDTLTDGMDLLSLTLLELREPKSSQEDFLELEKESNENEEGSSKLRRSKHDNEETKSCNKEEPEQLRTINLDEVSWHDTVDNCWIVIHDYVYDCTDFLNTHPGGSDVILEYAGRDATLAFIGTGHSTMARQSLQMYLIGELPPEERIFRVPNGLKVTGF